MYLLCIYILTILLLKLFTVEHACVCVCVCVRVQVMWLYKTSVVLRSLHLNIRTTFSRLLFVNPFMPLVLHHFNGRFLFRLAAFCDADVTSTCHRLLLR